MYVIVGLGNPGSKYTGTRHNIGFELLAKLCRDHNITMKNNNRFKAHTGEGRIAGKAVLLVAPMTYMNLSGNAVRKVLQFYKLTPADMVVAYDDVNLPVGDIRVRERGSAAGQKGMVSIIENLRTDEFARIRMGVGDKPPGWTLSDYVLSKFLREELDDMFKGVDKAAEAVEQILQEGVVPAMNKHNKRMKPPKPVKEEKPVGNNLLPTEL